MNKNPKVFGTFGVELDPQEFEFYDPKQNIYNINLVPDCRVFIFGMDVTQDVINVNVNKASNRISGCSISLSNPRGKFILQPNDLRKKWREDKDILDAYTFDSFKKQYPKEWYNKVIALAGSSIESTYQYFTDMYKKASNQSVISTRMVFETKFYSGMDKKVGEAVFDYRDPVVVFFKGRFSPYWYFGFSGVIVGIDDAASYGDSQILSLECADPLHLWDKQHIMKRSSMLPAGRFELQRLDAVNRTNNLNQSFNIKDVKTYSFNKFLQFCAFGYHDLGSVFNNNLILNNISDFGKDTTNEKLVKDSSKDSSFENDNRIDYFLWSMAQNATTDDNLLQTRENIREIFKNCNMYEESLANKISSYTQLNYMFSQRSFNGKKIPHPGGKVHQGSGAYTTGEGPNTQRFSTWQLLYLQLFKIAPKVLKTQNEIPKWYESSLRFWEKTPTIPQKAGEASNSTTGWIDGDYFCVAGVHPAMTHMFLNNFNVLPHIWGQVNKSINNPYAPLDRLVISPADKIREIITGSPTEYPISSNGGGVSNLTHASYFRPRLFTLLPRRYNSEKSADIGQFLDLSLFDTDTISSFGAMLEMCKKTDYVIYTSNMGDIFIEPELYDTHPKLYMEPKQYKNFYCEASNIPDPDVSYRSPSSSDMSKTITDNKFVSWFGERSTHPLTIMLKDECRCTQTFRAEQMATSVEVHTALSDLGESTGNPWLGNVESLINNTDTSHQLMIMSEQANANLTEFRNYNYVASGIDPSVFESGYGINASNLIDRSGLAVKKAMISYLIDRSGKKEYTLFAFLKDVEATYYFKYYSTGKDADRNTNYIYTNILKQAKLGASPSTKVCGLTEDERKALMPDDVKTIQYAEDLTLKIHNARRSIIDKYYDVKLWGASDTSSLEYKIEQLKSERNAIQAKITLSESGLAVLDTATSTALGAQITAYNTRITAEELNLRKQEDAAWANFDTILQKTDNGKSVSGIYYADILKDVLSYLAYDLYTMSSLNDVRGSTIYQPIIIDTFDVTKCTKLVDLFSASTDNGGITFYSKLVNGADSNAVESSFSNSGLLYKTLYKFFTPLFRDTILCVDAETQSAYEQQKQLYKTMSASNGVITPRTLGELKILASEGKYTPKLDLMRMYGYNPAPPKTFFYVQQKLAGRHYAMMYLNQYLGQAFTIQADIIGRPELQLNRPMYIASKHAIGTLSAYTLGYACGDLFNSHVALNYIRKNDLTYEYSLGHYMDSLPFNSGVNQNSDFSERAATYYKFLAALKGATNIANALNSSVGTLASERTVSKVVSTVADKIASKHQGLHEFHGEIGQIELDHRMTEDDYDVSTKNGLTPTGIDPFSKSSFRSDLQIIENKMATRDACITAYNSNVAQLDKIKKLVSDTKNKKIATSGKSPPINGFFVANRDLTDITSNGYITPYLNTKNISPSTELFFGNNGVASSALLLSQSTIAVNRDIVVSLTMDIYNEYSMHKSSAWNTLNLGSFTKDSTFGDLINAIKDKLANCGYTVTENKDGGDIVKSLRVTDSNIKEDGVSIIFDQGSASTTDIFRLQTDNPTLFAYLLSANSEKSTSTKYDLSVADYIVGKEYSVLIDCNSMSTFNDLITAINSKTSEESFPVKVEISDGVLVFKSVSTKVQIYANIKDRKTSGGEYIPSLLASLYNFIVGTNLNRIQSSRMASTAASLANYEENQHKLEVSNDSLLKEISQYNLELYGSQTFDINAYNSKTVSDDLSKWTKSYFDSSENNAVLLLQKNSLFGKILLNACSISGLTNWQIDYNADYAHDATGASKVKKYVHTVDVTANSTFNTVQKFVWQTGDLHNKTASSIQFKNGYPTEDHIIRLNAIMDADKLDGEALNKLLLDVFEGKDPAEKYKSKIKEVVDYYRSTKNTVVSIIGFTCYMYHGRATTESNKEESRVYNQGLSERRAKFIAAMLAYGYSNVGVETRTNIPYSSVARITGVGWAEDFLLDKQNKINPKNRRVEIYITKESTVKTIKDYTVWEDWNTKEFVTEE